jgi:hypothetical protein
MAGKLNTTVAGLDQYQKVSDTEIQHSRKDEERADNACHSTNTI